MTAIPHRHAGLLTDHQPGVTQLIRQRVFVDLFQKPSPERIRNGQRTADGTLGDTVQHRHICIANLKNPRGLRRLLLRGHLRKFLRVGVARCHQRGDDASACF
ncbi:MAG TPA: hypothetical protein VMU81_16170, partial [Acetobacteraceae bacterium]|nr:hypothetical protein [Acetobacteraceae bacterium]